MRSLLGQTIWRLSLAAVILCAILSGSCSPPNNYPVISSLQSAKDWVEPVSVCKVECVASDPDSDSLTYTWSATAGTFSGTGPVNYWMSPDKPGPYAIAVTVADGRGGEATKQLAIAVIVNHPPVIESLNAEPSPVRQGNTATITCVASDPDGDELSYLWSASRGNVSGEGSTVTWTSPNGCGSFTIGLTVEDGRGGEAIEELEIKVIKPG